MDSLRQILAFSGCYFVYQTIHFSQTHAFSLPTKTNRCTSTTLYRNSPGFVGFQGSDTPNRSNDSPINSRRSMDDPFAPQMSPRTRVASPQGAWQEPPSSMYGPNIARPQSNLSPYSRPSVNDMDPRSIDINDRYSQRPHPSTLTPPHHEQSYRGDGRIQGGSRQTYANFGSSRTFVESDGRPLDVEMEVWDGPNNTPSRVRMYSEDGRMRPMNILSNDVMGRGGVVSVRNVGTMEFPVSAGVSGMNRGRDDFGGPEMIGAPIRPLGESMMPPSGIRQTPGFSPSMSRVETVQGGALKTFSLPYNINAVQVTITSDGLPVNAKVELWGTSSHIKQLAEVYNDNGQTRPFAAIIDVPGGENTIAVRNTGPMEYPIKVVVEPVGMGGRDGGGEMMDGWDVPPPFGMGEMMGPMMLPPGPW